MAPETDLPVRALEPDRPLGTGAPGRLLSLVGSIVPALVLLVFVGYAVRAGLPAGSAVRQSLAVLVTQVLPGTLLWRSVRPLRGWWLEDVVIGFAFGVALAVPSQTLAGLVDVPLLAGALPLALAAALLAAPRTRARLLSIQTGPLPWWFGPSMALVAGFSATRLQSYFATVPLTWRSGYRSPAVDTYLHLALSGELAHRGPLRFPWVQSELLGYHWFSHAWIASVAATSGTEMDGVLERFMPALLPVAVSLSIGLAALRLSGRAWTGSVAAYLAFAGGDADVFGKLVGGAPVAPLSPSLGLAIPTLITLVVLLALRWRGEIPRTLGSLLAVTLVALASSGTKGSTLPLVLAGLGLAAVAMAVLDRTALVPVLKDLAVVLGCLVFALVVVFRGSGAGLAFDPGAAAAQTAASQWFGGLHGRGAALLAVAVTVVGVLSRGATLLALLSPRSTRRDPVTWLLLGGGLAGAGAVGVFSHPGKSQFYFALTGQPLLAIGSALGLVVVVDRLRRRAVTVLGAGAVLGALLAVLPTQLLGPLSRAGGAGLAAQMLAVAGVALLLAALVGWLAGGRRWRPVLAALAVATLATGATNVLLATARYHRVQPARSVSAATPLAVSQDQITAARWIRDHSGDRDLVMTNRHCVGTRAPQHCDSRRFVVTAFSERQVLLEGWTATPRAAVLGPKGRDSVTVDYWHPDLLALNDDFIARPDAPMLARLQQLGVRWVFADATRPRARTLEPYARLRYSNPGVAVYELDRPTRPS